MKKLLSKDIYPKYKDIIKELRLQGLGRVSISNHLNTLTGCIVPPYVTAHVMSIIDRELNDLPLRKKGSLKIEVIDNSIKEETQIPIDELIKLRIDASRRKTAKHRTHKKSLTLPAEPFGIMVFGDPHVDNEGCDWETLLNHVKLIQRTEGVLAASVGDMHDNWIGRLARCYSEAAITAKDGWRLSEWLFQAVQWIAIVGGNHDAWANGPGVDPMELLTKKTGVLCYAPDEIRIELRWKNREDLDPLIWIIRHDFKGRSWYHPTHGPHKEAMLDGKCHLLTAGHIHQWGQLTTEQRHGRITNAIRVRGYKRADSYALEKGFFEQKHGESCLVVINPTADNIGRIQIYWDLKEGCKYLTHLRTEENK
tara:strand:- start:1353 stop:2450 length:1098 start_codon:yes stop_codon:yes gene_type:complete